MERNCEACKYYVASKDGKTKGCSQWICEKFAVTTEECIEAFEGMKKGVFPWFIDPYCDKAISALKENKEKWIPTQNANDDIPKEGCYWVTLLDGKVTWIEQIYWDTYYERLNYAEDSYPCDKENVDRIVAYMEVQKPEPYRKGG